MSDIIKVQTNNTTASMNMRRSPFIATEAKIKEHAVTALSALYGSEELSKYAPPDGSHEGFGELASLSGEIFEGHMVALAAMVRAVDEQFDSFTEYQKRNPNGVGKLETEKGSIILTVREACNKIIHANEAQLEWRVLTAHPLYEQIYQANHGELGQKYKVPFLSVMGTHRGKKWHATINLILWVHAVCFYT